MEIVAPAIIGLGYLYIISKQKTEAASEENFQSGLPNINIPNKNYPDETVTEPEVDLTSALSTTNAFDSGKNGAYTDKFFKKANPPLTGQQSVNVYTSLAGQNVDVDYFRHNNMQPYFGSKSHTGGKIDATESTMDAYQGGGSQYISKREIAPMFEPGTNLQYAFGTPNQTDFIKSRINPSLKMSNVKPFEEIKVAPGIGLGYNEKGVGGFNNGMLGRELWRDKTVDELRVANKQKASSLSALGFEGPAYSFVQERGHLGIQEKNRVDTAFEMGPDRLFTTTGIQKGQTLRSIENIRDTARQTTTQEYVGVPKYAQAEQHYVKGEYMEPHSHSLGSYPITPAYASNQGGAHENDYSSQSFQAYTNNRTINSQSGADDGYFGILGGAIKTVVAPIMDVLRPSRKENVIGTMRPYQNPKSYVEQSYVFNPNDVLPTTMRETMEHSLNHLNVNSNQRGGGYQTTVHQPVHNERDTTTDFYYAGIGSAGERNRAPRLYDAEYRQRNNDVKSSTIDGRLVPGNMSLLQGNINLDTNTRRDNGMLENNRAVTGLVNSQVPSMDTFGKLQGGPTPLFQGVQLERNNGDIMKQLKGNPYTTNILNGL